MITVKNLIYEYPGRRALNDVSFTIQKGSITALVGPNGAGKTTLLKCLSSLVSPFNGQIRINGIDILKHPRKCHTFLGFLPDFFGLYDTLTVRRSFTYFAKAHKITPDKAGLRAQQVAEQVNLADRLDERITNLSRGMRQRVAIGQAMIHDPEVLLLDEPASGLDPEARYNLSELFINLNRAGKTLVVSSHILAELDQYATDVLILKNGAIVNKPISLSDETGARKLCIRVIDMPDDIDLSRYDGVEAVKIEGEMISMMFTGNDEAQHLFLKDLMASGLKIREFFIKKEGVQEQYLETLV